MVNSEAAILHAVPDLRRAAGGIASAVISLHSALRMNGVASFIVTTAADPSERKSPFVIVSKASELTNAIARCCEQLSKAEHSPSRAADIVFHSHGLWSPFNHKFCTLAVKAGAKLVISPHGMLMPEALSHKRWKKALALHIYQRRDLSECITVHVASDLEADTFPFAALRTKIRITPFGVEVPSADIVAQARRTKPSHYTLLILGRLDPIKNIDGLLRALSRLDMPKWKVRIVGPGIPEYRASLKSLASQLFPPGKVTLETPVFGQDKAILLAQADLLALPSHSENFGNVVLEALAHGTPVIASDRTPWTWLPRELAGWYTPIERDSFHQSLFEALSTERRVLELMGDKGREVVVRRFSSDASAMSFAAIYSRPPCN